jgi:hypothetical protein
MFSLVAEVDDGGRLVPQLKRRGILLVIYNFYLAYVYTLR